MVRVGVIGATGYAGAEVVRILCTHPYVELTILASRQYAGERFDSVYPAMAGVVDLVCEELSMERVCDRSDFVFTALPHKLPMSIVPELIQAGKKVVDLSADFRYKDAAVYESFYEPHTAKNLLEKSVYGLCEVFFEDIKNADIVGCPGCYPTGALLPLVPLLKADLLEPKTIVVDSKSGVSGAGRGLSLTTHFCEANESFKAYKVAEHRHNSEMEEVLNRVLGKPVNLSFVPHLVPMSRGILTTIYATPAKPITTESIRDCIASYYSGRRYVRICPDQRPPDTMHVKGTNFCDIGFKIDERNNRLILMSAIDNMGKGAAGQAVQNMNIMLGLDEAAGLSMAPYPF
jgi:N-acetyl-gamma-glutamyl-phosphate reductase